MECNFQWTWNEKTLELNVHCVHTNSKCNYITCPLFKERSNAK